MIYQWDSGGNCPVDPSRLSWRLPSAVAERVRPTKRVRTMSISVDVGGCLVCFPVWIEGTISGRFDELKVTSPGPDEIALPVFTDHDGAQAFVNTGKVDGYESILIEISDPLIFVGLLSILQRDEVTHVIFDPYKSNRFRFSIGKVIDDFADQITKIANLPE
jgi:hypothetical protein